MIPKFCQSWYPKHFPSFKISQQKTSISKSKDEIKYVYIKKQQINAQIN
jgi:hypothetical protein